MERRAFGLLGAVSRLSLGGAGLGQVRDNTTREEVIATMKLGVDAGISFIDATPVYDNGDSGTVVGDTFNGNLPDGVAMSTKCALGNPEPSKALSILESSPKSSLECMKLGHFDILILHNYIIADDDTNRYSGTPRSLFANETVAAFERLLSKGMTRFWGITGIGIPDAIIEKLNGDLKPHLIRFISNLLDSPGSLRRCSEDAKPRAILNAAMNSDVAVAGIRSVQARALTDQIDHQLPYDHPEATDYHQVERIRELAKELNEASSESAHNYALSIGCCVDSSARGEKRARAAGVPERRSSERTGSRNYPEYR